MFHHEETYLETRCGSNAQRDGVDGGIFLATNYGTRNNAFIFFLYAERMIKTDDFKSQRSFMITLEPRLSGEMVDLFAERNRYMSLCGKMYTQECPLLHKSFPPCQGLTCSGLGVSNTITTEAQQPLLNTSPCSHSHET